MLSHGSPHLLSFSQPQLTARRRPLVTASIGAVLDQFGPKLRDRLLSIDGCLPLPHCTPFHDESLAPLETKPLILRRTEESKAPPKEKKFLVSDTCARQRSAPSTARPDNSTHHIDTSSSSSTNAEQPPSQTTTPATDASTMPPKSKPPRCDPYRDASRNEHWLCGAKEVTNYEANFHASKDLSWKITGFRLDALE